MNPRALFFLMIAAAMLFAPLAMQSGAAMAMAPTDHHSQMMESGHCDDSPSDPQQEGQAADSCCAAMCSVAAVAPALSVEPLAYAATAPSAAAPDFRFGFLGELPTPPPRTS